MKKRMFWSIFGSALLVVLVVTLLILHTVQRGIEQDVRQRLQSEVLLLERLTDDPKALEIGIIQSVDRITYIAADGTVLQDNLVDAATMENHKNRPEVQQALQNGTGQDERRSDTLSERNVYYALRLSNGNVLRVAGTMESTLGVLRRALPLVLLSLAVAMILSTLLARRLTYAFLAPILQIDLKDPLKKETYPELRPVLTRMDRQNSQVEAQLTELRLAGRERQDFSANVSHELKTPLTSIMGYAEIMENGIVQPQDIPRFAGKIRKEAARLLGLIGDIIRLSRLDEGTAQETFEPLDLLALCQETYSRLIAKAQKNGVSLSVEGEHMFVHGARMTLSQMIFNLCDNAIAYNRAGGSVVMTVGRNEDGAPFVRVADTGIGIAAEDQEHVFERFYRADKSRSKLTGGTGLGLSIVKHGAALHHASVSLQSREGEGTTITLTMPRE